MSQEPQALEYFSGGVPTGEFFRMTLHDLQLICNQCVDSSGINRQLEIVFIGLLSYFEAFCKDQFAAILNIEPRLLESLKSNGQDTSIDATNIPLFLDSMPIRIGFLVAEKYDFGTARKINALYSALLKITPFSKDEIRKFDRLQNDRNLIVHHGGVYTLNHLKQKGLPIDDIKRDAFMNSVTLNSNELSRHIQFIGKIAQKIMNSSHLALLRYLEENNIEVSGERKEAIDYINWWGTSELST